MALGVVADFMFKRRLSLLGRTINVGSDRHGSAKFPRHTGQLHVLSSELRQGGLHYTEWLEHHPAMCRSIFPCKRGVSASLSPTAVLSFFEGRLLRKQGEKRKQKATVST